MPRMSYTIEQNVSKLQDADTKKTTTTLQQPE